MSIVNTPTQVNAGATASVTVNNKKLQGIVVVVKSVDESYTRTFDWTIEKVANPTRVDLFDGESEPVAYDVTVTKGQGVDSAWAIAGTIQMAGQSCVTAPPAAGRLQRSTTAPDTNEPMK